MELWLALLAAVSLLGWFATEISDTDFWWHLKTGQYIVQHRALPAPDPFSYTAALGRPAYEGEERVRYFNLTHEWLAQSLWYLVFRVAGFAGVVLLKALLLTGFCGLAGLAAAQRTGSLYWGLGAAAATGSVASMFSADRPALVTFLMVAVFVYILERGRPLWVLPPLSLLWANMHGGFFLSWVVLGAYAGGATLDLWLQKTRRSTMAAANSCEVSGRDVKRLWIAFAVSIAASGLNPSFFRVVEILMAYRRSRMMQSLIEWRPPYLWGPPYSFDILLYASAAVLVLSWRKVRGADWLLFAAFTTASLAAFRNIMLTAFLAPILIASYFPWKRKLPVLAAPAAALAMAGFMAAGLAEGRLFQLRAALWKFPAGAADFVASRRLPGNLFNTYEYGGYLIWRLAPERKVFIDGRALNESVYRDYTQVLGNAGANAAQSREIRRQVLARYDAGVIVANAFEYTTGTLYPMILWLADAAETDWQLVYEEPQALVFVRHPPSDVPAIDKSRIADHLEAECRLHIEKDPELSLCARTLGFVFSRAGDRRRAGEMFQAYLASPHDPDAEAVRAYAALGESRR